MEILVLTVIVALVISSLSKKSTENNLKDSKKSCDLKKEPHKWSYNVSNTLQCLECDTIAGQMKDE
jgi:hypothetical protein